MSVKIAALVVTYNRKILLRRCLDALFDQSRQPDVVYVVDNASTDDTRAFLEELGYLARDNLVFHQLTENIGGSGGFHIGVKQAVDQGADWVWMMDDDAEPESDALQALEQMGLDPNHCYGSSAVYLQEDGGLGLCWPAVEAGESTSARRRSVRTYVDLPNTMNVGGIPFLGFMVSSNIVGKAGLPEAGYFVSGDDMDYSERINKAGAGLGLVKASRIRHPKPDDYAVRFLGQEFFCLKMPPWRRYYDIRNRVLNGRRHFGYRFLLMTLPGVFVRWGATLLNEPGRARQSLAYARGIMDGLCNRLGKRWEPGL